MSHVSSSPRAVTGLKFFQIPFSLYHFQKPASVMPMTQKLHPEAKSAAVPSPCPAVMASRESSVPTPPAQEVAVEFPSDFAGPSPAPRAGQTVFERIPSAKVTQSRRVLVTTLLILANLVQVGALVNRYEAFRKYKL